MHEQHCHEAWINNDASRKLFHSLQTVPTQTKIGKKRRPRKPVKRPGIVVDSESSRTESNLPTFWGFIWTWIYNNLQYSQKRHKRSLTPLNQLTSQLSDMMDKRRCRLMNVAKIGESWGWLRNDSDAWSAVRRSFAKTSNRLSLLAQLFNVWNRDVTKSWSSKKVVES